MSRYVLIIQESSDGRASHAWQLLSDFELSGYSEFTSQDRLDAPVLRASFNRDCEAERDRCEKMCKASLKGRNWTHASDRSKKAMCSERCLPAYTDCCKLRELAEAGKLRVSFPAIGSAVDWLKQHHRELLVGAVVVIAGVAFVVVGSGGGALVLAPFVLLAAAGVPSVHALMQVVP
ncbi:hypothetical protein [Archangium violaceum]|uniref:hypothetical protein n=1 Tax=Archangium violaceum TaxID=83451 RepID=UPI0036D9E494